MNRRVQGFTLLEVLAVLALAGILAAIAAPDVSDWLARRRADAAAVQMQTLLRQAQYEAVRRNAAVYICPAQVKKDMTTDNLCDGSRFGQAFVAWADSNGSGVYDGNDTAGNNSRYAQDETVGSLIVRAENGAEIQTALSRWQDGRASAEPADIFAFLPDGTFRRYRSRNNGRSVPQALPRGGDTRIEFFVPHSDKQRQAARAAHLWLDGQGGSYFCRGKSGGAACRFENEGSAP